VQTPDGVDNQRSISRRRADQIAGIAITVFGAIVLSQAVKSRPGMAERLDPRTVPLVLSGALVIAGLTLVVNARRYGSDAGTLDWPNLKGGTRVAVSVFAFAAYAVALSLVGMAVATAVFVALVEWFLDRGSVIRAGVWGLASGFGASLIFVALLAVQLPSGPLDNAIKSIVGK
jgi:hypothetical protein